jgi:hypothetical protein
MKLKEVLIGVAALAVLGFAIFRIAHWTGAPDYPPVTHLFWCQSGHLFNFEQVAAAGRKTHPQARGEGSSVLVCVEDGCENPSYPVERCRECGTRHVLFIWPQLECPVCHPEIAEAAAAQGIDLTPEGLPRR